MLKHRQAFTLLELLVVISLMMVAIGMAAFRMDGLTDSSRLRSGATQLISLVRLTQTQARAAGEPRQVEYRLGSDRIVVHSPQENDGTWTWDQGLEYIASTGVQIKGVLIEGNNEYSQDANKWAIRVGPDGRHRAHAVILEIHGRYAVVVLRRVGAPRCVFPEEAPHATSFELLMLELEQMPGAS